jgi:hypothetical protein
MLQEVQWYDTYTLQNSQQQLLYISPKVIPMHVFFLILKCDINMTYLFCLGVGTAGYWGSYECDIPVRTFEATLKHIKQIHQDVSHGRHNLLLVMFY